MGGGWSSVCGAADSRRAIADRRVSPRPEASSAVDAREQHHRSPRSPGPAFHPVKPGQMRHRSLSIDSEHSEHGHVRDRLDSLPAPINLPLGPPSPVAAESAGEPQKFSHRSHSDVAVARSSESGSESGRAFGSLRLQRFPARNDSACRLDSNETSRSTLTVSGLAVEVAEGATPVPSPTAASVSDASLPQKSGGSSCDPMATTATAGAPSQRASAFVGSVSSPLIRQRRWLRGSPVQSPASLLFSASQGMSDSALHQHQHHHHKQQQRRQVASDSSLVIGDPTIADGAADPTENGSGGGCGVEHNDFADGPLEEGTAVFDVSSDEGSEGADAPADSCPAAADSKPFVWPPRIDEAPVDVPQTQPEAALPSLMLVLSAVPGGETPPRHDGPNGAGRTAAAAAGSDSSLGALGATRAAAAAGITGFHGSSNGSAATPFTIGANSTSTREWTSPPQTPGSVCSGLRSIYMLALQPHAAGSSGHSHRRSTTSEGSATLSQSFVGA